VKARPVKAVLTAVEYHLPEQRLTNLELGVQFGYSVMEQVTKLTGVKERRVSRHDECGSDLAAAAGRKLFAHTGIEPSDIDFLLNCTEGPDYYLPATACLLQERLGLSTRVGALDFSLGCSGYVYGLSLAKGLIETGQARRILLLTGDTPSKVIDPTDRSVRPLFGDAGSASLIEAQAVSPEDDSGPLIGPFVFGTDGSGADALIVPKGGFRALSEVERTGSAFSGCNEPMRLHMNGSRVYEFMRQAVPTLLQNLLAESGFARNEIDIFVFHQASQLILERLRRALQIPTEAFCFCIEDVGNTVSSTIPIALKRMEENGRMKPGNRLVLAGFGVGFSWGATVVHWKGAA
jgi:3-oxoacyl-[acyl-carrier-protein] synthase III